MANRINNRVATLGTTDRADAFFNISVKLKGGSKQIGGIPLYASKELHQFLIDNEANLENASFEVDIHVVNKEPQEFAFA